ncbi:MAG TPA: class II aldolase/adducin family protein [Streptosporangiaceae bacterium]
MTGARPYSAERRLVALACRVLALEGLAETTLGHVSLRVDERHLLVRGRRDTEHGLLFTTAGDIALADLDGQLHPGEPPIALPSELPIHTSLLAARPDCTAVVHAHPPAVVACTVADVPLRPIAGAYNVPAMRLALGGIPVYGFAGLIRTAARAGGLLAAIGDRPVCLLRGHGLVATGESVAAAMLAAIDVHALAKLTVTCWQMGRVPLEVDPGDHPDLPVFGPGYHEQVWRFYAARAGQAGGPLEP